MGFSRPGYQDGVPCPPPGDLPNPGIETRSPALRVDSLPAEPQGEPKNPGVGGLSLLQQIFLTQESNRGLLHCRWILYQLSHQGSPIEIKFTINVMHLKHPQTLPPSPPPTICGKIVFHETSPWSQKDWGPLP